MMQSTLKPHTIFCHDNLPVLRGINSNSIDMVYLDPPFNKGKQFHAPVGREAEGADFEDIWREESVKDEWHEEIKARQPKLYKYLDAVGEMGNRTSQYYLIYMAVRLFEMHRVLKNTGGLYLHCDPTMSHYLKLLMDCIFGEQNFENEVVWWYSWGKHTDKRWNRKHDIIFYYAKNNGAVFFDGSKARVPYRTGSGMTTDIRWNKKFNKEGKLPEDVFDIPTINGMAKERTGYPTQKPIALLERIIKASCPKDGIVLDPFCGCATTCVAASKLGREWIGIDVSSKAFDLVKLRIQREIPKDLLKPEAIYRNDFPARTDVDDQRKATKEDKQLLYGKQDGRCNGCKQKFDIRNFEIDHIVPRADGGGNEIENLQLLCGFCNRTKGKRSMAFLMATLKKKGIRIFQTE